MEKITREAGQRIREIRLARDSDIRNIMRHARERIDALKAGRADPGPSGLEKEGDFARLAREESLGPMPVPTAEEAERPAGILDPSLAQLQEMASGVAEESAPGDAGGPSVRPATIEELDEDIDLPSDYTNEEEPSPPTDALAAPGLSKAQEIRRRQDSSEYPVAPRFPRMRRPSTDEGPSPEERLQSAEVALKAAPNNPDAYCRLASVQVEMGMQAHGMINYLRAAEGYAEHGDLDKAMQIYNLLTMITPEDFKLHEQMVRIALRLHNKEEAMEKLKWMCGQIIENEGLDEAVRAIDRIIEEAPLQTEIHTLKAEMLANHDRRDEASKEIARSVGIFVQNDKIAEAHSLIARGQEIDPENEVWEGLKTEIEEEMRRSGIQPVIEDDQDDEGGEDIRRWLTDNVE